MIKVKITYPHPIEELLTQLSKNAFSNIAFYINPPEDDTQYDYWIVYNHLRGRMSGKNKKEHTVCPQENTIFIAPEGYHIQSYFKKFYNQFATVFTCQNNIAQNHPNAILHPPFTAWFVKKTYDELKSIQYIEKTKSISVITSNKVFTSGHRKRLDFVNALKEHFKDKIDLYGRGIKNFDDKWDVLAPYKYSIAIENSCTPHYFTEKIFDCFLSHTFPIYYGCPNIEEYYNSESYAIINLDNFKESVATIERILDDEKHYKHALPSLMHEKEITLEKYNLFPYFKQYIEEKENERKAKNFTKVTIRQTFYDGGTFMEKLKGKIHRKFN